MFIRFESEISGLFDVAIFPGIRNPRSIGTATEEISNNIRFASKFAPIAP